MLATLLYSIQVLLVLLPVFSYRWPHQPCPQLQGMLSDAQFAETFARSKWRQARWAPSRIRMVRPLPAGLLCPEVASIPVEDSTWCARRNCPGAAWPRQT